jgi:hypothetical protein
MTRPIFCQKKATNTEYLTEHGPFLIEQAAREALTEKVFVKGPDYKNKFGVVFGDGLVTSTGEKHKGKSALFPGTVFRLLAEGRGHESGDDTPTICTSVISFFPSSACCS